MCASKMTEESEDSDYSSGSYDDAIVAIAICDGSDLDIDNEDDDVAFGDIIDTNASSIDDADIDHEETWLRRCNGDLPGGFVSNHEKFTSLPQEMQVKLLLDLREREKATLLESLRYNCSLVDSLKAQLCESESKRFELEGAIETGNIEVEEMRRQFDEMKELHKCRIEEIERITKEMIAQKERLSTITNQQQRSENDSPMLVSSKSDQHTSLHPKTCEEQDKTPAFLREKNASETKKSMIEIEIEIENKLRTNLQYREEFERFKEFQSYLQASKSKNQHYASADANSSSGTSSIDHTMTLPWNEEYRKLLEFQLIYDRMFSSASQKEI